MSWPAQLLGRTKFDFLIFRRNPAASFFAVILPIIFLVLFTSIFGNETLDSGAKVATFYVPGILGLSIVSATLQNLSINTTIRREKGVLKRLRGTPLPPWIFIASQLLMATMLVMLMTFVLVAIGWLFFEVAIQWSTLPALLIALVIGTASFSALGLALSTVIPSENAAPAITNGITLPLYFISDVFLADADIPRFIEIIGNIFPLRHLVKALQPSFDPFVTGSPMHWGHWAAIAAWGVFGVFVAATRFEWSAR